MGSIIGIIPARAGSKRLPGKNTKSLSGKPLVQWTFDAAHDSTYLDRLIVSTDDPVVMEIGLRSRIEIIERPCKLAGDTATSYDVVKHVLDSIPDHSTIEAVVLLQPTSPLRTSRDIDGAIDLFREKKANAIVSVCPVEHSPLWMNTLPEDNSMRDFLRPEIINKSSQELPMYYRLNGAIYVIGLNSFLNEHSFLPKDRAFAFIMPIDRSIDIDTEIDFRLAELLLDPNK